MRVPDRRAGASGGAHLACAFDSRCDNGRASDRRLPARGSVHDARSERPCGRPSVSTTSASGHRLVPASDGRRSARANTSASGPCSESREIEELVELPLMSDAAIPRDAGCPDKVAVPALVYVDQIYFALVSLPGGQPEPRAGQQRRLVHSPMNCLAMFAGPHFGNYEAGFRFGRLGYELVERRDLNRFQARTFATFGFVMPWTKHVRAGRDLLRRAFEVANATVTSLCGVTLAVR